MTESARKEDRKQPRVLCISMSPRRGGNSEILLNHAIQGIEQAGGSTKLLRVIELNIEGCAECGGCDETGSCVIQDDMTEVYPLLLESDAFVIASPIFFYGLPAQGKAFIDRTQALWVRKYRLGIAPSPYTKPAIALLVGGTRGKQLFDPALLTLRYFLDILNAELIQELTAREVDAKGEMLEKLDVLRDARTLGADLVRTAHERE